MRKELNLVTSLHTATKRDYLGRMNDSKVEAMMIAKQYGADYWDGDRKYGYGGYKYDGRWKTVAKDIISHFNLKKGAKVGTSSARRKSQTKHHRPDVSINDLRGNVPTRIEKLRSGNYDAILLAKAGVDRLKLDLSDFLEIVLDPLEFVPAPAQGVLGLQIRTEDKELFELLQTMNNSKVQKEINLERKVLNLLEGGCQLPLGVFCRNNELFVSYAPSEKSNCSYFKYHIQDFNGLAEKVISDLMELS